MRISASKAIGAYAAVMTLGVIYLTLGGATSPIVKEINVERINIREPDGTLRLAIANSKRIPGIIIGGKEYPHPNRTEAGMIFFNDEGTENGGLVFDGKLKDGKPTNGGSLTFDRWHQDQTIQLTSLEDGQDREAAVKINDRPDTPLDFSRATELRAMAPGPERDAAYKAAGFTSAQRAYLGRSNDKSSQLVLRDADGKPRLMLRVAADGEAEIRFIDAAGKISKAIRPAD